MTDQEALALAAQFAGCPPDQVKSHRRTGDGGIVIIDPQGRKFTLSGDELEQIQQTLAEKERAKASPRVGGTEGGVVVDKIEDKREDVRDRAEDRRDRAEDRRDRREDRQEAKEEHPRRRR